MITNITAAFFIHGIYKELIYSTDKRARRQGVRPIRRWRIDHAARFGVVEFTKGRHKQERTQKQ